MQGWLGLWEAEGGERVEGRSTLGEPSHRRQGQEMALRVDPRQSVTALRSNLWHESLQVSSKMIDLETLGASYTSLASRP